MAFQGEYFNSIDAKGRASIPAEFRKVLESAYGDEQMVVTKNTENGLTVYPFSAWEGIVQKVQESPNSKRKKALLRFMVVPAKTVGFDAQGRIPIPLPLREFAGFEKDIVVMGMFDKVEIYSKSHYAAAIEQSRELLEEEPDFVDEMGL